MTDHTDNLSRRIIPVAAATGLLMLAAGLVNWMLAPLVLVLCAITFTPLLRRRRIWFVGDVENEHRTVHRRREEALRALKDLEDDHISGKLDHTEYERLRPGYLAAARELTQRMDEVTARRQEARRRIEQDLASHQSGK
jgi:hypothetical protein